MSIKTNTTSLENILNKINNLPEASEGVELPELTNEGTSSDLLSGKQLIDQEGNVVTGSMPNNGTLSRTMDGINTKSITIPTGYTSGGSVSLDGAIDNEVTEQADLIAQIKNAVDNLPEASSGGGEGDESSSYNTCNVIVRQSSLPINYLFTTTFNKDIGLLSFSSRENITNPVVLSNVVCGTIVILQTALGVLPAHSVTGGAELIKFDSYHGVWLFYIPQNSTGDITITVRDDD